MKERPILFSAPMVIALRENRKTQTRRTRGLDAINAEPDAWELWDSCDGFYTFHNRELQRPEFIRCPYGVAGDRVEFRRAKA